MQNVVHTALQKQGYPVLSERRLPGLPMQVDVLTRGVDAGGRERNVVLEVDGPSHFLHSPDGPPQLSPDDELKAAAVLVHDIPVRSFLCFRLRHITRQAACPRIVLCT